MKTDIKVLTACRDCVKILDKIVYENKELEDHSKIQKARDNLIQVIINNGYEIYYQTYKLIKRKYE